ncbi:MAG: hypothetical protein OHM56_02960 [Spiroplasma phoeniceum]|nr:MAG: hypothetical protein OHM57_02410 [Spiroplasma phoeniceum]UZQ32925.1 MAG: hypothetical protein OHM56_02960 [Spiroplasma phoeniceum]
MEELFVENIDGDYECQNCDKVIKGFQEIPTCIWCDNELCPKCGYSEDYCSSHCALSSATFD